MKSHFLKIWLSLLLLSGLNVIAQVPQKMSYQSVVRNASNQLLQNASVGIKISILQGTVSGTAVYSETHSVITNANGLFSLGIGGGNVLSGVFNSINWANGPYFVKSEIDPSGGADYTISGTSQLLSVPYALFAENVVNPKFSVSATDYSTTFLTQTIRNSWVDDPDIALTVPETGKYLLAFNGSSYQNNETFGYETSYDGDNLVRVYNSTSNIELFYTFSVRIHTDLYTPSDAKRKYIPMNPARTMIVDLVQGDVLKIQYIQYGFGNPLPSGNWIVGNGGISIVKIGN